jgi:hypothetical protein
MIVHLNWLDFASRLNPVQAFVQGTNARYPCVWVQGLGEKQTIVTAVLSELIARHKGLAREQLFSQFKVSLYKFWLGFVGFAPALICEGQGIFHACGHLTLQLISGGQYTTLLDCVNNKKAARRRLEGQDLP